jgi:adenylate cyclase
MATGESKALEKPSPAIALPSTEAIGWLLRSGAGAATVVSLLGGLCECLVKEGIPLAGARLTVSSLDPMVAQRQLSWRRSDARVTEEIHFHGMAAVIGEAADSANLTLTLSSPRHQIEFLAERSDGFETKTRQYLNTIALAMTPALQAVVEKEISRSLLQAYLGRRVADRVLNGTIRRGTGEVIDAVMWISDLRDFTQLSETLSSSQLITALNDCCARLVGAIQPFGGEVLKFIGDGLLAIFPVAPKGKSAACNAALAAVRAARNGMARLDVERLALKLPPLPFGVALHLGPVVYGNIGAPDRLDFTAIGPAVNVASRIEGLCKELDCPVLISHAVASSCTIPLVAMGTYPLRGSASPVALYTFPEMALK